MESPSRPLPALKYPHLIPKPQSDDAEKDETNLLQNHFFTSFPEIRTKTFETLYGQGTDKSPKGSVDQHIQDLVDLINCHNEFTSVSSCSGRISLFDPYKSDATHSENQDSGKGGAGGWLLVSHDEIGTHEIDQALRKGPASEHLLSLKFEPLLLHIAASNMTAAEKLLKLVMSLGFRESGIMVSDTKCIVAIRSYAQALSVPLSRVGAMSIDSKYLQAFTEEINRRLRHNLERINDLEKKIETNFFERKRIRCSISKVDLPDLNLWEHATVCIKESRTKTTLLVFGGYGTGPSGSRAGRNEKFLKIQGSENDWHMFGEYWGSQFESSSAAHVFNTGVEYGRQGLQACAFQIGDEDWLIYISGGRTNPETCLPDTVLRYRNHYVERYYDDVIEGDIPAARWGHCLARVGDPKKLRAILVGGRNGNQSFNDVYQLSLVDREGRPVFTWEKIEMKEAIPPLFGASVCSSSECVFVSGGFREPRDALDAFQPEAGGLLVLDLYGNSRFVRSRAITERVGHSICRVKLEVGERAVPCLALLGGTDFGSSKSKVLQLFELIDDDDLDHVHLKEVEIDNLEALSSIGCLTNGTTSTAGGHVVSVGGGTDAFAFGPTFASCFELTFAAEYEDVDDGTVTSSKESFSMASRQRPSSKIALVVYVEKRDAKVIKTLLEESMELSTVYRMGPAVSSKSSPDVDGLIAVPITDDLAEMLNDPSYPRPIWYSLIRGIGEQELEFNSASFAKQSNRK